MGNPALERNAVKPQPGGARLYEPQHAGGRGMWKISSVIQSIGSFDARRIADPRSFGCGFVAAGVSWFRRMFFGCLLICFANGLLAQTNELRSLIIVVGAAGQAEYGEKFAAAADLWKQAATNGGFKTSVIGLETNTVAEDRNQLLTVLTNEVERPDGELWLVLIGHGSFDGKTAKFNLRGPDITAEELAAALKPCRRPLAFIDCSSASGPFLNALSAPGRVIVTATRSGYEANVTRFGDYFAHTVADRAADLDKDGQTSLLESYLMAARQVEQFYKEQGRLATEHALLDDNGDGLGTPADWFAGVRAARKAENGKSLDGLHAQQMNFIRDAQEQQLGPELRARRDVLEQKLNALREKKADVNEEDYYRDLEIVLTELAKLYQPAMRSSSN